MSKQYSPERIERVIHFQRKNHLYKLIALYRFKNSRYFKVSKIIRIFYILFSVLAFCFHSLIIFQKEVLIKKTDIEYQLVAEGGKFSTHLVPVEITYVYVDDMKIKLLNHHEYLKPKESIKLNFNVLGKITSLDYKQHNKIPCKFPKDMRYVLLIMCIPVCFTFYFNEYQNYGQRLPLYIFTFLTIPLILLYYILL